MATQIKLYIDAEGEIRRFTLEQAATYASLQQRIQKLLGRDNFRLFWQGMMDIQRVPPQFNEWSRL